MQIDRTNCMELILQEFPTFRAQWDRHLADWNPIISRPIALDLTEFADFAIDLIGTGSDLDLDRLSAVLELMLVQGDAVIEYATRTMCLEKLAHRSRIGRFPIDRLTPKFHPFTADCWQALVFRLEIDCSIHH